MSEGLAYEALARPEVADTGLDENTLQILREDIDALEARLCDLTGADHCVLAADGRAGLLLALRAAGIGWGDKVLCSGFAPREIARTILLAGGVPELVDIHPNTYNLDPYCLRYTVGRCVRTQQPIPKALVANDQFGLPCNYQALEEICDEYGIALIRYQGEALSARPPGEREFWGRFTVLSFSPDPGDPEEGEGGAVLCATPRDREAIRDLGRQLRHTSDADHMAGETVLAGLLLHRLEELVEAAPHRQELAAHYLSALGGRLRVQQPPEGYRSGWTAFAVSLPGGVERYEILEALQRQGALCSAYVPCSTDSEEAEWERAGLLHAQKARDRLIQLPIHPQLTTGAVEEIARRLVEAVDGAKAL